MREVLIKHFFTWGWLIPAILPGLEVVGRAPLNIALAIYLVWGCLVLFTHGLGSDKRSNVLYALVILIFGLGLLGSVDPMRGLHAWVKFTFFVLVYFMTSHALVANVNNLKRQYKLLALGGVLCACLLIIKEVVVSDGQSFVPFRTMMERNLPFLLPFVLFSLQTIRNRTWRSVGILAMCSIFSLIIIYSGGRSTLVGLVVALFIYCLFGFRVRLYTALAVSLCVLLLATSLGGVMMTRNLTFANLSHVDLDIFSSQRTVLWRQALTDWPENPVFGVGMGNVRYSEVVTHPKGGEVRHLHNFLLDCWYETGFAGLMAYLIFLGSLFVVPVRCFRIMPSDQRSEFAPVIAGIAALLAGACFSYSYYSPQMTVYLFFLIASLRFLILPSEHVAMPK